MDIKEGLLVTVEFLLAANKARADISISAHAFNRVAGIAGILDIAKSDLAPDKIYERLKPKAERFLAVEWENLQSFGAKDYGVFAQARSSIADDILPCLGVVAHDWTDFLPPKTDYSQALSLVFNDDELGVVMTTLSVGYAQASEDIKMILEPNMAFLLRDMRVRVM